MDQRNRLLVRAVALVIFLAAASSISCAADGVPWPADQTFSIPLQLDSGGQPLDAGSHRYTLTFAPHGLPPADLSWSLTMYDLPQQELVTNLFGRHAITSQILHSLARNADGSITIYIQKRPPGGRKDANWLPAPAGPFMMLLRLEGPEQAALDGAWEAPPVERVE
ncbi:MAG: DUF1214 domain-containing protein [Pirellulales bacterium]